jgi:hypothetical protein
MTLGLLKRLLGKRTFGCVFGIMVLEEGLEEAICTAF